MSLFFKIVFTMSCIFLWKSCAVAQPSGDFTTYKTTDKKVQDLMKEARVYYYNHQPQKALELLEKVVRKDPKCIDAYSLRSDICEVTRDYDGAKKAITAAHKLSEDHEPYLWFRLGRIALAEKKLKEAIRYMEKFMTYPPKTESQANAARRLLADAKVMEACYANPVKFEPKNLGAGVNSGFWDYMPTITADGQTLLFTRRITDSEGENEDFFVSKKQADGTWGTAENAGSPINSPMNEGTGSLSADGKLFVYAVCNRREDYGSCDLYSSDYINNRWTQPKNMGPTVNTGNWESHPCATANGNGVYFTRGRNSLSGDSDLYFVKRNADGSWGTAKAITELITTDREESPFIHPDGKTLFFRSTGHPGLGSFDLFRSQLQPDGKWGTPQNLGYPINTEAAESGIIVALDGKTAYFNSHREGGFGGSDIYSFELPPAVRATASTFVRAKVIDAETKLPLLANVDVSQLSTSKLFATVATGADGIFLICLPIGEDYALAVDKKGYLFHSENFVLPADYKTEKPFELVIELQKIGQTVTTNKSPNKPVVLKNVFFNTASAVLLPTSKVELDRLKTMLTENPTVNIQLNGHTDNVGDDASNMSLSEARALAVLEYLKVQGIAPERLKSKGFGETLPVESNDTPEGRAKNRRTEFQVTN